MIRGRLEKGSLVLTEKRAKPNGKIALEHGLDTAAGRALKKRTREGEKQPDVYGPKV